MFSNKAFKSDSQRSAFSLRSSIAERSSHLNAALYFLLSKGVFNELRNLGNVFPSLSNCDLISRVKRIVSSQK
ncbi:hypothetical protein D3729_23215 [Vibrio parahaemolyticus]|nr:hypothetical protein [Vibrio parahaemolyticus]